MHKMINNVLSALLALEEILFPVSSDKHALPNTESFEIE